MRKIKGFVKKHPVGHVTGEAWAHPDLGEEQEATLTAFRNWLTKQEKCKCEDLPKCPPEKVPSAFVTAR